MHVRCLLLTLSSYTDCRVSEVLRINTYWLTCCIYIMSHSRCHLYLHTYSLSVKAKNKEKQRHFLKLKERARGQNTIFSGEIWQLKHNKLTQSFKVLITELQNKESFKLLLTELQSKPVFNILFSIKTIVLKRALKSQNNNNFAVPYMQNNCFYFMQLLLTWLPNLPWNLKDEGAPN